MPVVSVAHACWEHNMFASILCMPRQVVRYSDVHHPLTIQLASRKKDESHRADAGCDGFDHPEEFKDMLKSMYKWGRENRWDIDQALKMERSHPEKQAATASKHDFVT